MGLESTWSYGDLFELSENKQIQALSITSDGKNAIAVDTNHINEITIKYTCN